MSFISNQINFVYYNNISQANLSVSYITMTTIYYHGDILSGLIRLLSFQLLYGH